MKEPVRKCGGCDIGEYVTVGAGTLFLYKLVFSVSMITFPPQDPVYCKQPQSENMVDVRGHKMNMKIGLNRFTFISWRSIKCYCTIYLKKKKKTEMDEPLEMKQQCSSGSLNIQNKPSFLKVN